jgi:hypothetical protein
MNQRWVKRGAHWVKDRERRKELGLLTREDEGEHLVAGEQSPAREIAREGVRSPEREQRAEIAREMWSLAWGRARGLFLKRVMGASDSLQCLSGAHQIAHSSCPAHTG